MQLKPERLAPLHVFRMYSSAADASRRRRPTDVALLAGALLLLALLTVNAPGPTSVDQSLAALLEEFDSVLGWFWSLAYAFLLVWVVVVLLAPVVRYRYGRLRLLWDYALALALSVVVAVAVGALAGTDVETSLDALVATTTGPVFVPSRLAVATALIVTASPHLTRPFRIIGRWVLLMGALAAVALGLAYASGALAGVALGLAAAAVVHLLRGSPGGLLTPDQVAAALLELGITPRHVTTLPPSSPGEQRMGVEADDGQSMVVKVIGRDAWDAQYIGALWLSLTRRGEPPQLTMTRRERVQHEAMVSLFAERAGVPVLPVVTAGEGLQGEAMVVTVTPSATLGVLEPADVTDRILSDAWTALEKLHRRGVAHRQITASSVSVQPDGVAWAEFDAARLAPSVTDLMLDRVHLLVTTWLLAGPERAVDAAAASLGRDEMAKTLPYLQDPALSPALRRAMGTDWVLEDLRARAMDVVDVTEPDMVELRRVSVGSLVKLLLTVVIVSTLVSLFAGVDFSEVADQLRDANWALLMVALVVAPLAQLAFSFSTIGASARSLPYVPVLVLQYAIQFMALVFPSTGARAALQIRFFQRLGVPSGASISMGMIDGLSGFVVQVSLLLLIALSSLPGVTTDVDTTTTDSGDSSSDPSLLALVLVIALVWGLSTLLIPTRRARAKRAIPRWEEALKDQASMAKSALVVVKHPGKLSMMLGGNLGGQVVQAVVLGMCLSAFGESASLSQLILVNTFVSLFAGLMPVPGGVGVAEAGYTFGLQAVGVPSAVAVSTAIAFRLVTFYVPPLWGSLAMRWLRRNAYV